MIIGKFHEIDFCSKKSYCEDDTFENWVISRDPAKVVCKK